MKADGVLFMGFLAVQEFEDIYIWLYNRYREILNKGGDLYGKA